MLFGHGWPCEMRKDCDHNTMLASRQVLASS